MVSPSSATSRLIVDLVQKGHVARSLFIKAFQNGCQDVFYDRLLQTFDWSNAQDWFDLLHCLDRSNGSWVTSGQQKVCKRLPWPPMWPKWLQLTRCLQVLWKAKDGKNFFLRHHCWCTGKSCFDYDEQTKAKYSSKFGGRRVQQKIVWRKQTLVDTFWVSGPHWGWSRDKKIKILIRTLFLASGILQDVPQPVFPAGRPVRTA